MKRKIGVEQDEICNRNGCKGRMNYEIPSDCYCSPMIMPCYNCENTFPTCSECGLSVDNDELNYQHLTKEDLIHKYKLKSLPNGISAYIDRIGKIVFSVCMKDGNKWIKVKVKVKNLSEFDDKLAYCRQLRALYELNKSIKGK